MLNLKSAKKGLANNIIAVMIALVVLFSAALPVVIDSLNTAGVNGTARTVALVVPTGLAISGLLLAFAIFQRRQ